MNYIKYEPQPTKTRISRRSIRASSATRWLLTPWKEFEKIDSPTARRAWLLLFEIDCLILGALASIVLKVVSPDWSLVRISAPSTSKTKLTLNLCLTAASVSTMLRDVHDLPRDEISVPRLILLTRTRTAEVFKQFILKFRVGYEYVNARILRSELRQRCSVIPSLIWNFS